MGGRVFYKGGVHKVMLKNLLKSMLLGIVVAMLGTYYFMNLPIGVSFEPIIRKIIIWGVYLCIVITIGFGIVIYKIDSILSRLLVEKDAVMAELCSQLDKK